eukprot:SAG31_NODE_45_length_31062_cov_17.179957_20_plen_103_part_00
MAVECAAGLRLEVQEHAESWYEATLIEVRGYFLVFVQLFEIYGTLIERYTALIEKVSACIGWPRRARKPAENKARWVGICAGRVDSKDVEKIALVWGTAWTN